MKGKLTMFLTLFLVGIGIATAQTRITGTVIDESGEPVIGATVIQKGNKSHGTTTDIDGKFTLSVPSNATLVITYVGMKAQEVPAAPNMSITMQSDSEMLQEVVVTGMTVSDKRLFSGATDRLTASDVRLGGLADVSRGLEGRSAGVSVQNVSGTFGTAPKIRVRGATSIHGNSKPLWVVDGVIMDDVVEIGPDALSSGDAITLISSAIAGLNPEDIESFQILKDGSATSIYGARAMAGVIVITTKRGKEGVSNISYSGEFTTRLKPSYNTFNILNSQDQMGVYEELRDKGWLNFATIYRARNSGVYGKMYHLTHQYNPTTGQFGLENSTEARQKYLRTAEMRNTEWFDLLFSNSLAMNHSVSMSSGNEKSSSYVSLSAMNDPGWMKQTNVQRYTANLNNIYNITKELSFNTIANAAYRHQKAPGTLGQNFDAVYGQVSRGFDINPYSYALNTSRTLHPDEYYVRNFADFNIFNELETNNIALDVVDLRFQGEFRWKHRSGIQLSLLGALKYSNTSQEHKIQDSSNQAMAYRAMEDATIRDRNSWLYKDPDNPNNLPISILPKGGFYNKTEYKMFSYDFRFSATYNTVFNDAHILNTYAGIETNAQDRTHNWNDGWGMQYEGGEIPFFDYLAFKKMREGNVNYYGLTNTRRRNAAFFGTATYSYRGRYSVTGTGRYEGSNRLGKSRAARWLPTWNIAGLWNMHEESFFSALQPALSHFTLKASYSLTADAGPTFVTNSRVEINNYTPWRPSATVSESGSRIVNPENGELTYEKKHELNIGVDMGFFKNRVNLSADWFRRNNYDLIGQIITQGGSGHITPWGNAASMRSNGFEFTLTTRNIETPKFKWETSFIYGFNQTVVTDFKSKSRVFDLIAGNGFAREGYPVRGLFSIPFLGLDKDGYPTFEGSNGKITKDNYSSLDFQDREKVDFLKYEGPTDPTFTGSLGNIFTYGSWRLNLFITYAGGNKVRLHPVFSSEYNDLNATPKEFNNRWKVRGDEKLTDIPVIANVRDVQTYADMKKGYNAYNYSSARVASGAFARMKEISVTYTLPNTILKGRLLKSASIKLQATNLFLIYSDGKLYGQDPEFYRSGGVSAPVPKQFTCTLRLGF